MPGRVRHVVLTEGGRCWWGVDPSSHGVSVAWRAPSGNAGVLTVPILKSEGAHRLGLLHEAGVRAARDLADAAWPGIVVVEAPLQTSRRGTTDLVMAAGALRAGLWLGLAAEQAHRVRFEDVVASTWKRDVCGYGGIKKPKPAEVKAGAVYQVLAWARQDGYVGDSWDEADAWAIAAWGEQTFELRPR